MDNKIVPVVPENVIFRIIQNAGEEQEERELLRLIEVGASCFNHYCAGYSVT